MTARLVEGLAWIFIVAGAIAMAAAGTARTMLYWGKWRGRPLLDRAVDWMEERPRTQEEARLFRIFWLGFVFGGLMLFIGLVLFSGAQDGAR